MQRPWALVTGASSGIGAAFARRIAATHDLVLVARRADRLAALAAEVGGRVETVALDLSRAESVAALMAALDAKGIAVDLLFNNAGYGANGDFTELGVEPQLTMIDVNCRTLVALSHAVGGRMRAAGRGTIVHTASMGGLSPTPYYATYGATKAFIVAFSEALAEEMRPHGVTVKTLCPGATESEFEAASAFKGTRPPAAALQTSDDVAAEMMRALARRGSMVITGRYNRLMALTLRFVPRRLALSVSARGLRPVAA